MSFLLTTEKVKEYSKQELLLVVKEYILEQIDLTERKLLDEESFNKPSWSEYQAFQLGIQKAFSKIEVFIPYPEKD